MPGLSSYITREIQKFIQLPVSECQRSIFQWKWFLIWAQKKDKLNWKIYLITLSLLYKIEEHSALDWNIFALLNMMTFSILARKETDRIYSNQNHLKNHSIFLCKKDTLQPTSLPRLLVILFSKLQVLLITVVVLTTNNLIYLSCHSHIDHHLISAIAKKDNNLIL